MIPAIKTFPEKKLLGQRLSMTYAENKTFALWSGFMPRRKEIKNTLGSDLYSLQIYPSSFNFTTFDLHTPFEKWAATEVSDFKQVPAGMETLIVPEGLYAVFLHKGPASDAAKTFSYIFGTWLPASQYVIDNRPHFEILGAAYKNNAPDSEEEVWVPVKKKD